MAGRAAKARPDLADRLKRQSDQATDIYSLMRNRHLSSQTIAIPTLTGGASGSSSNNNTGFLKTVGDTMIGPIAYHPTAIVLNASDELVMTDVASSYIVIGFSSPDALKSITGAQFAGQQLWLQIPAASTLTIEDYSSNAGGNIVTSDGNDIVITTTTDPVVLTLLFDVTVSPNSNTGGWVVLNAKSITGGSATAAFPLDYAVDDQGSKSGTVTHSLTAATAHKLQFTATADCDITITGVGSGNARATDFYIEVTQDSTGGWAITANDSEWVNFPTLSTTPDTVSLIACHADGDGNIRAITLLNASQATSGATKELDNLTTTAINTDLLFDAGTHNIGDTTNPVDDIFVKQLRFQNGATVTTNKPTIYETGTDSLQFNVPTGQKFFWSVNNVQKFDMSESSFTGPNIIISNVLTLNDSTADPSSNGGFTRNSTDVKVYSGGAVRNMSNIGVVAGGANVNLSNLTATSINDDLLPQAGKTLGDSGNLWSAWWGNNIKFGTAGVIDATINQVFGDTGGLTLNTPSTKKIDFAVAGTTIFDITNSRMSGNNIILSNVLTVNNLTSHPGANGDIYREGNDVKIFSGGNEINISSLSGGVQTPWASNIDAASFQLNSVSRIDQNGTVPTAGFINMANSSTLAWEASPAGVDGTLTYSASEHFTFGSSSGGAVLGSNGQSLGLSGTRWGTVWATAGQFSSTLQVDGNTIFNGDSQFGNSATDTATFTADVVMNNDVSIGLSDADTITINGLVNADIDFTFGNTIDFNGAQSTVGSAGGASSLPSSPTGYIVIKHAGTEFVIPYYAKT